MSEEGRGLQSVEATWVRDKSSRKERWARILLFEPFPPRDRFPQVGSVVSELEGTNQHLAQRRTFCSGLTRGPPSHLI